MQVDLPAFERPTKAISGTSKGGKKCNSGAVVRNFAVCSHPNAMAAGDFSPTPALGAGGVKVFEFVFVVIE